MCAKRLLQKLLEKSCGFMHKYRINLLTDMVLALTDAKHLTMTALGNRLASRKGAMEKHSIKRVCRFLSNKTFCQEIFQTQKNLSHLLLSSYKKVVLIVDWTPANTDKHYVLRANLIQKQSSFVLLQEIYDASQQNNPNIELNFLDKLKQILPDTVTEVIVITDAGFYGQWFRKVMQLGWCFVGRVRSTSTVSFDHGKSWKKATEIAKNACSKPKYLGSCLLTKRHKLPVEASCYKQKMKPLTQQSCRKRKRKSHSLSKAITACQAGWFLVSNLTCLTKKTADLAINHYRNRMKIEAGNRSTKSSKYGFGFEQSMTKKIDRLKVLLIIEQITSLLAWIVGRYTEIKGNAYQHMNGSMKKRRRLSLVNLGLRVLKQKIKIPICIIDDIFCDKLAEEETRYA